LDPKAAVTLASGVGPQYGLAADESNVYWTTSDAVWKVAVSGGTPTQLAPRGGGPITVDTTNVYWTSNGAVLQMAK
jgi:hypothetical protein